MNKKKILTLALTLSMVAILAIGGTIAYFTDSDAAKNVLTVGNVSIIQHEKDRDGNPFDDSEAPIMRPVTDMNFDGDLMDTEDNWIDKIVTVENDGSEKAYIRTLFAFKMLKETDEDGNVVNYMDPMDAFDTHAINFVHNPEGSLNSKCFIYPENANDDVEAGQYYGSNKDYCMYKKGDDLYSVAVWYYSDNGDSSLNPGETSKPSLCQVGLEPEVTNEQAEYFKDYEILVVSQAVQTEGFTDAKAALDEAFGAVETADQTKLNEWFSAAID